MHREDDRQLRGQRRELRHRLRHERAVHPVAVQGDDEVPAALEPALLRRLARVDPLSHGDERVDHRVADVVDRRSRAALGEQVVARLGRVDEEQLRELVGDDAVQLLRQRPVERAQARLDVAERNLELRRGDRGRHRRVDVARDEHHVGLGLEQHRLEPLHDARGLLRVRAGSDPERIVGLADPELLEEDLGQLPVVVLPRVHEDVLELVAAPLQLGRDRRDLHHVRPRADDRQDLAPRRHRLQRIESRPVTGLRCRYSQPGETGCFAGRQDAGRRRAGARSRTRLRPGRQCDLGDLERHRALDGRFRLGLPRRARDQESRARRADPPPCARARRPRDDRSRQGRRRPGLAARLLERRHDPRHGRHRRAARRRAGRLLRRGPRESRRDRLRARQPRRPGARGRLGEGRVLRRDRRHRAAGSAARGADAGRARRRRRARPARPDHPAGSARSRLPRRRHRAGRAAARARRRARRRACARAR